MSIFVTLGGKTSQNTIKSFFLSDIEIFEVGTDDNPSFDEDRYANDTVVNIPVNQSDNDAIAKLLDDFRNGEIADSGFKNDFDFDYSEEQEEEIAPDYIEEPSESDHDYDFDDTVEQDQDELDDDPEQSEEDSSEQPFEEENPESISIEEQEKQAENEVCKDELEEQAEKAVEDNTKFDEGWLV